MTSELVDIVLPDLSENEIILEMGSSQNDLVKKVKGKTFKFLFMFVFVTSLFFIVFLSDEFDQLWIVGSMGKVVGFGLLLIIYVLCFNLNSFFQKSEPSKNHIKYSHFLISNERMFLFSQHKKKRRVLNLDEITHVDVTASLNRITFYLNDPLEPTVTLNGIESPLNLAKCIDGVLFAEFGV